MANPNAKIVLPPASKQAAQRAQDIEAAQGGGQQGDPARLGKTTLQWAGKKPTGRG